MYPITQERIDHLCVNPKIRKIAVENATIGEMNFDDLWADRQRYGWNAPTWTAIMKLYHAILCYFQNYYKQFQISFFFVLNILGFLGNPALLDLCRLFLLFIMIRMNINPKSR